MTVVKHPVNNVKLTIYYPYHLGERIHIRVTATMNGVVATALRSQFSISLKSCKILHTTGISDVSIQIIKDGLAVTGPPFPVTIDHNPGVIGNGVNASDEGVGFSFQVFTFGPGSTFQLT